MYIFNDMIDMGLKEGETWKSDIHKKVAQNCLLCNPRIHTRDALTEGVGIINSIPDDKIKLVTAIDLMELGVPGLGT